MDCAAIRKLFAALMAGDLPHGPASEAEEHLLSCEDCSREFEAFETRFFRQYEPAGKQLTEAAGIAPAPDAVASYGEALRARLDGLCAEVRRSIVPFSHSEVDPSLAAEIETHLQSCEGCSREFEQYESRVFGQLEDAGKALAAARSVPPPEGPMLGFVPGVMNRVAADRRRSAASRSAQTWVAIAATLVIAVSVGYLASPDAAPVRPTATPVAPPAPLPKSTAAEGLAAPASVERRYRLPNLPWADLHAGNGRAPGGIEVIRSEGGHSLDDSRPIEGGEAVGF
jgi:predicted anti-sigma-YlaC factor YlaD